MPLAVDSRRKSPATLQRAWLGATLLDVTSRGPEPWVRFSPFFPHGNIPVPGRPGVFARSVEGIWQGLKVFEAEEVDEAKFEVASLRGLKRVAGGKRGRVLGHRYGPGGTTLLAYREARRRIYLPAYRWVLDRRLATEVGQLRQLAAGGMVVLLDYETNVDVEDLTRPLSHAVLVRCYVEGRWPGGGRLTPAAP